MAAQHRPKLHQVARRASPGKLLHTRMEAPIETFDDFWPHYVHAHRHPLNRALHYVGTTAAVGTVVAAAVTLNPAWLVLTPVAAYGPAWIGHFVLEKNKPATFEHPLWSLRGDLKMCMLALSGKMAAEVERVCGGDLPPDHTHADHRARGINGATTATA
jgi:hypothetical protein